jgi:hypothetical protein
MALAHELISVRAAAQSVAQVGSSRLQPLFSTSLEWMGTWETAGNP